MLEIKRMRSNAAYYRLSEHQRECFNHGLPTRYMGRKEHELLFADYMMGADYPVLRASTEQGAAFHRLKTALTGTYNCPSLVIGIHGYPSDDAAMCAAGLLFETAVENHCVAWCFSLSTVLNQWGDIPKCDVYVIYGVMDEMDAKSMGVLRNFLRERDGSLRIVVMTSDAVDNGWNFVHDTIRMHEFDGIFCLQDSTEACENVREVG